MRKVKLYQVPQGSKLFGFEVNQYPTVIIFDHLDGAYSVCHAQDDETAIVHLSVNTPLTKVDGGYQFEEGDTASETTEMGAENA